MRSFPRKASESTRLFGESVEASALAVANVFFRNLKSMPLESFETGVKQGLF
jgi:hypothetical protein